MYRWSVRQFLVACLAVFVTAGIGVSVVQASDMTVKMATASDMGAMADSGCKGCSGSGGDDGASVSCLPVCSAPGAAMLPEAQVVRVAPISRPVLSAPSRILVGRTALPDPYPPRSSDFV